MLKTALLPPLPDAEQMRIWDSMAIDFGLPETLLMENAAQAVFNCLVANLGPVEGRAVLVLMGSGNNGGDAACVARYILAAGGIPLVCHTRDLDKLSGAAKWHALLALKSGVQFQPMPDSGNSGNWLEGRLCGMRPEIIVDGLLGTGFQGTLSDKYQQIIQAINQYSFHAKVVAIDTPSGLNATTGQAGPIAIRADLTVTLAAAKPGLVLPSARNWTGELYCGKIGFPSSLAPELPASMVLLDGRALLPGQKLPAGAYKNTFGHLLVIGGSSGLEGAAHLASASALRTGAGLVTAYAPAASANGIKSGWPEIMFMSAGTDWPDTIEPALQELLKRVSACVVGPGLGRSSAALRFLECFLKLPNRPPAVFDADALILMSHNRDLPGYLTARDVCTPHPGEAAALLQASTAEVQNDRPKALLELCRLTPACVVLKGAATLVGQTGEKIALCPYDIPQMAIGGSGDVLAGCAGALLAAGKPAYQAAAEGVLRHVLAGAYCAGSFPDRGMLASQLADCLPRVQSYLQSLPASRLQQGLMPWP